MSVVKVLIVEDERLIAENLSDMLEELGYQVCEPCISYGQALETIETESPTLALLDIQLAGRKDGIDLAERIRRDYHFPFIFLTSFSDKATVERAKKTLPNAYLVKPFRQADLFTAIEIAVEHYQSSFSPQHFKSQNQSLAPFIFVKQKDYYHKVLIDNILFIRSDHVYLRIHTSDNMELIVRSTVDGFMKKLPQPPFFKTNRSTIVNLAHVSKLDHQHVEVAGNHLPISKSARKILLDNSGGSLG